MRFKFNRWLGSLLLIAACLSVPLLNTGCNKTTLAPGSAYSPVVTNADGSFTATQTPDKAFYEVDSAFELAYSTVEAAFNFERNNREALFRISPDIKHGLDKIRPAVGDAVQKYTEARKVYKANPVPANLDALNFALAKVQQLTTTATAVLPTKK